MSQQFEVLIIGGGIVGLTAALAMAQRNFAVAIIDASDLSAPILPSLRVYAINQASEELFQKLGVWAKMDSNKIAPYQQMHVWDAVNGACIDFDARLIAANRLGAIIEDSIMRQALMDQIKEEERISIFSNFQIDAICKEADAITIGSKETTWRGQLLMIADGANSRARQLLQIPLTTWSYKQQAIVATVSTEKSHRKTAWQVFNKDDILAFLPLVNERQCSIVWSTSLTTANDLINLSEESFNQRLTESFAGKLGQVQLQSQRHYFPLTMRHVQQYSADRWLILGDAAHSIHPLAGLGLNMGLSDIATWLTCLDENSNNLLAKKALSAYQRRRKHAVWQIIALMDGLKTLFKQSSRPLVALRGLGLTISNQLSPLKRFLIEHATGKVSKW